MTTITNQAMTKAPLATMRVQRETVGSMAGVTVTTGTSCPAGGDAGKGGYTMVDLEMQDMYSMIQIEDEHGRIHFFDQPNRITLVTGGDSEHDALIDGLGRGLRHLRRVSGSRGVAYPLGEQPEADRQRFDVVVDETGAGLSMSAPYTSTIADRLAAARRTA